MGRQCAWSQKFRQLLIHVRAGPWDLLSILERIKYSKELFMAGKLVGNILANHCWFGEKVQVQYRPLATGCFD